MSLREAVEALHDRLPPHTSAPGLGPIHPWVGEGFQRPDATTLRVAVVGLNAYISGDSPRSEPHRFAGWVRDVDQRVGHGTWRYYKAAMREATRLTDGLAQHGAFPERSFRGLDSLYVTNAVRRYLPAATGKRAHDVDACWFVEGERVWSAELELFGRHGAIPHVVVVFGGKAWAPTWRPLRSASWMAEYRPRAVASPLYHRLNLGTVNEVGGARQMMLVRLNHPATPRNVWRARHLLHEDDMLAAVDEFVLREQ